MKSTQFWDVTGQFRFTPLRIGRGIVRAGYVACFSTFYLLRNRYASGKVAWGSGPVVSLTTHGQRVQRVHIAMESILHGTEKPSALILWLDDESLLENLPTPLQRLRSRGVQIRISGNFGPHTKYFPLVCSKEFDDRPLVTADDDVLYPKRWLQDLTLALSAAPKRTIVCHRAHRVGTTRGMIDEYGTWRPCSTTKPSFRNFATGVSGVIYPAEFHVQLRRLGDAFVSASPKADDVWLHWAAVENGWRVQQVSSSARLFPTVRGTQATALLSSNVAAAANDAQIAATYTESSILKICQAE